MALKVKVKMTGKNASDLIDGTGFRSDQGNTSVSDKTTPIGKSGGASTGPRLGRMQDDAHSSFKRTDKQVAGKMPAKFRLPSAKTGAKSSSMT
jgi:hypothetical protein